MKPSEFYEKYCTIQYLNQAPKPVAKLKAYEKELLDFYFEISKEFTNLKPGCFYIIRKRGRSTYINLDHLKQQIDEFNKTLKKY